MCFGNAKICKICECDLYKDVDMLDICTGCELKQKVDLAIRQKKEKEFDEMTKELQKPAIQKLWEKYPGKNFVE